MRWSELPDLDGPTPTWTLPARRSKNGHGHTLPLGPMAVSIIKRVPRMVSRDALFGQRAGEFTAWGKNKRDLDARSGVHAWTVHDLRRTAATRMADNGTPPHVIEEILNHRGGHRGGIGAVYIRIELPRRSARRVAGVGRSRPQHHRRHRAQDFAHVTTGVLTPSAAAGKNTAADLAWLAHPQTTKP